MHIQIRISGPRGCGKTFLLNKFAEYVQSEYPHAVVEPIAEYDDVTGIHNEFLSISVLNTLHHPFIKEKFDVT